MNISAYLLPHQDDEIFIVPKIRSDIESKVHAIFFYLSKSAVSSEFELLRRHESEKFLAELNVSTENIFFVGHSCGVFDGVVLNHIAEIEMAIANLIKGQLDANPHSKLEIICPAYEGGHQDHDAGSIIGRRLAKTFGTGFKEFFMYNARYSPGKLYRVAFPYGGGLDEDYKFRWLDRWNLVRALTTFKSQRKAMLGLWPFLMLKSFFYPLRLKLSKTNDSFTLEHDHLPMYERWGRISHQEFCRIAAEHVGQ